jgi:protein TonB
MKRQQVEKEPSRLLEDPFPSDTRELKKAGALSLLLHIVLIVFLVLNLKMGNLQNRSTVYRVTVKPYSLQKEIPRPIQKLPAPPPVLPKPQIQKEEKLKEKVEEPVKKPVPLPIAETVPLKKEENIAVPLTATIEKENKNTAQESSSVKVPGAEPGGACDGKVGFRWGRPGDGTGHGSSGGDGSGKGTGLSKRGRWGGYGDGTSGVSLPGYGVNPKPVYPPEARDRGCQGDVILKVEVLSNGRVGQIEVGKSSGYEALDQSALATVKKWRFIPAKRDMVAIPCWVNIPIKFQLK